MVQDTIETLAARVGERLGFLGLTLATAESCTGGWVSMALTSIAGSSKWFERGFVTYSNESKQQLLGVSASTLASNGAVSEAVAREMAAGALRQSSAQVAVSVTGIAGPDGGTPAKPVGTVCIACAGPGSKLHSATMQFTGNREDVRRQSVVAALRGVLNAIERS